LDQYDFDGEQRIRIYGNTAVVGSVTRLDISEGISVEPFTATLQTGVDVCQISGLQWGGMFSQ